MMDKVLIIAPHPDDEILGCGGTIKKLLNNAKEVSVLVVTNAHFGDPCAYPLEGIQRIRGCALSAHQYLGIKETFFMDFPAPRLDTFPSYKISMAMSELLRDKKFDTVFIPHHGDIHRDHKVVFDSALVACRPVNNCSVKSVYAYETLSETEWGAPYQSEAFIPNVFVELTGEEFNAKCNAMNFFKSQIREFPSSRSIEAIEALAKYRGASVSCARAEAFMLIRDIR